jgi:hypothetical protein
MLSGQSISWQAHALPGWCGGCPEFSCLIPFLPAPGRSRFCTAGMVAGAVPLLSSVSYAYWCFAIPVVVPISIRMMWWAIVSISSWA